MHLESLKEGINGLVSKNLGNDGVSGHSCHKLGLRQLVVLVPGIYIISFDSDLIYRHFSIIIVLINDLYLSPFWNISAMTVAISTEPESAPASSDFVKSCSIPQAENPTYFDEECHHVEQLVDADRPVAVLVKEVEDAEQVVLGLAVAEEVEQHAHAVES